VRKTVHRSIRIFSRRASYLKAVLIVTLAASAVISASPAVAAAAQSKVVSVGVVIDRTGANPENNIWQGVTAYFQWVNAHGGINGYKFNVNGYDDGGQAGTNAADVTALIQNHVPIIINDDGTNGTAGFPIAVKANVPVVGGDLWPAVFQNADLFPDGPYHATSSAILTANIFKKANIKKVAILALNVPVGVQAEQLAVQYAKKAGLQVVYDNVFPATQTDFTDYAAKIAQSGAVGLWPIAPQARSLALLQNLKQQGWNGKLIYFPPVAIGLAQALGTDGNGKVFSPEGDLPLPPTKTYLSAMAKYNGLTPVQAETQNGTEGWNEAQIVAHGVQLLGSKSPTAAHIKAALQSIKGWNADFTAPLTYGPGPHGDPTHCSQVLMDKNGKFVPFEGHRETCWTASIAP
jgi:branched-chain amino acid transport system substrate-binding protein